MWKSTCGYGITALTNSRIDSLSNKFTPKLINGDYYASMAIFLDEVENYL